MKKIATWNVASVRARLPLLIPWLQDVNPDVVFLQEIKATEDVFPFLEIESLGYHVLIKGQKGFNGVAILSKEKIELVKDSLYKEGEEEQARFLEVKAGKTHYITVYVPNGASPQKDPEDDSRLKYKLNWMKALYTLIKERLETRTDFVLAGDFNVIARNEDVYNPKSYKDTVLMIPPVQEALRSVENLGVVNALRTLHPNDVIYSFWDFQFGAYGKDMGMLLDVIYLSPRLADGLQKTYAQKEMRGKPSPSDHVPVLCELEDEAFFR
ncbi:MAG: exodeoxyribonuclease III [Alphaproteobacteria bacterium]|nr:exodeoxyribonuclease III [Alphaproteobacteria bacterium]